MRLKEFQKQLRTAQTDAEEVLWYHLRSRRLQGYKFRRQHSLQGYIVDFVCLECKVVIELDGGQHAEQVLYDTRRSKTLEADGFLVLRFWNDEVLTNKEAVLASILCTLAAIKYPSPDSRKQRARRPLPQGER
jgi:very-short-patch-repair endonuclease